ncbi:MAG: hypothetical protein ACFUZC_05000 [Chthoniobacteraceae bacterium]
MIRKSKHPWTSRKLWMTLAANGMMWAAYELALRHLYAIPDSKVAAFTALTQTVLYGITAVSAAYVGVTGFVQMRQQVTSDVTQSVEERIERTFAPKQFDDPNV